MWYKRENLSLANRLRRTYYELMRDDLDQFIINYGLVDSYFQFQEKKINYPFVERRELKPKARIPSLEYEAQNAFLVIFVEDTIPVSHKKYIRFFDDNKTTKKNFLMAESLSLTQDFDRSQKYLDSKYVWTLLKDLMPVDYALLIQRDPATKLRDRYSLTHFHVRIDWPIAEAAEELAISLRYISKNLYEKGDKAADDLQKKFFEYYGQPMMSGGRRTAAIVAAQYMKRLSCFSTIYAGSSESRAVISITEKGPSKTVLIKLNEEELQKIANENSMKISAFKKNYVIAKEKKQYVVIFRVSYEHTAHAKIPEDGKLRELNPDLYWLTIASEQIMPKPWTWKFPPIKISRIYT
ncbi:MAG: hypothetical protein CSB21_01965 [Deltaproteobacteria bacterium]|nr:MAG: hypothetical protein CSB21_01965 [Deltaproteobacteria bacterium]